MENPLRSLHHVTATVGDAQEDLDFYARLLGLRLVKKTVNFDNPNVYHFYYGDEVGRPSTLMTTFPYRGWNVREGRHGAGQITITSFAVPADSIGFWQARLEAAGAPFVDAESGFGEPTLLIDDPSGLTIRLVGVEHDARAPRASSDIAAENAIRGLHSVTLLVREPARTLALLTDVLGFDVVDESSSGTRVALAGDAPGKMLEIRAAGDAPDAINGIGTIHHVALAITDEEEQLRMRNELVRLGFHVTEVRDRQYFRSIYFREPNGVLYEIATIPPGFTVDETVERLGRELKLPPWEEPKRESIERSLPRVDVP